MGILELDLESGDGAAGVSEAGEGGGLVAKSVEEGQSTRRSRSRSRSRSDGAGGGGGDGGSVVGGGGGWLTAGHDVYVCRPAAACCLLAHSERHRSRPPVSEMISGILEQGTDDAHAGKAQTDKQTQTQTDTTTLTSPSSSSSRSE
jgi:hypothetical protein